MTDVRMLPVETFLAVDHNDLGPYCTLTFER